MCTSASEAQAEMLAGLRVQPAISHVGCVEGQVTGLLSAIKRLDRKAAEKEVCVVMHALPKAGFRFSLLIAVGAKSGGKGFTKGDSKTSAKGKEQWGQRGSKRDAFGYKKR